MSDDDKYTTKYRPETFAEVIGQDKVVRSLQGVLKDRSSHAFLFSGPSGTGKTTLARVCATVLGATRAGQIVEMDSGNYNGIDDVRAVTRTLAYKPLGGGVPLKVLILDEAHALSAAAFKALLKTLEEPPSWVYWFLCTTELARIPPTMKTRCSNYVLQAVHPNDMFDWLDDIAAKEKVLQWDGGDKVISLCVKEAQGSPRQALSNLAVCAHVKDRDEAADLLQSAETKKEAIDLCRLLMEGGGWERFQKLVDALKDTNPESVRQVVRAYMTKAALGAKNEKQWARCLEILDAFSQPCPSGDGMSPILLSVARACFAN